MINSGEPGEESLSGILTADGFIEWRGSYFGFSGKENEMWGSLDAMSGNTPHWLKGERYQHFGARAYDPVTCIFMQIDPMAEKYYGLTPYHYCAGNPVVMVDPDGSDIWRFDLQGHLVDDNPLKDDTSDIFMIVEQNNDGEWKEVSGYTVCLPAGSVTQLENETPLFSFSSEIDAQSTFEAMANNTNVEWSFVSYSDGTDAQVGTSNKESSNSTLVASVRGRESTLQKAVHSHPSAPYPSKADKKLSSQVKMKAPLTDCQFMIYHVPSGKYIMYNESGPLYDDEMYEVD